MIQSVRCRSFLLHIFLLAGQLRGARTGFIPLFDLAPPEIIPEVDDILRGEFLQRIEESREEEIVEDLDQMIGNSLEEELENTEPADVCRGLRPEIVSQSLSHY